MTLGKKHLAQRGRSTAAAIALCLLLSGCAALPVDPEGTLESVRSGTLRVGISPNGDFVNIQGSTYAGSEVELVKEFADRLEAKTEFVVGSEEHLVKELERGDLDILVGGITSKTPWVEDIGVTRSYRTALDDEGEENQLVILVPAGENAFLGELEYFLDETQEMP